MREIVGTVNRMDLDLLEVAIMPEHGWRREELHYLPGDRQAIKDAFIGGHVVVVRVNEHGTIRAVERKEP